MSTIGESKQEWIIYMWNKACQKGRYDLADLWWVRFQDELNTPIANRGLKECGGMLDIGMV